MSEIIESVPYLSISTLKSLKFEIRYGAGGEGWLLSNRIPEGIETDRLASHLELYLERQKADYQCDCILSRLERLFSLLGDFAASNFQPHIDATQEFREDDTEFDPYAEIEYLLATDGINDLPDKIQRFYDLLAFSQTMSIRKQVLRDSFEQFFGGKLMRHYQYQDENGETVMVQEDELPIEMVAELKISREVNEELAAVEIEHCLDNYDAWLAAIKSMISDRRPFSEILTLIKS